MFSTLLVTALLALAAGGGEGAGNGQLVLRRGRELRVRARGEDSERPPALFAGPFDLAWYAQ